MKNFVIGVIVGALVGALVGYLVWGRQVSQLDARVAELESKLSAPPPVTPPAAAGGNPHAAVIVVSGAAGTDCTAKVNPDRIGNKRNAKVYWVVDNDDAQCTAGNWRIILKFDNAADGTPWNGGDIDVGRNGVTPYKISNLAPQGKTFPYHVWYFQPGPGGRTYEMADPELEIEQ